MVEAQQTAAFFTGSSFPKPSLLSTSPKQGKQLARPKSPQLLEKVIVKKTNEERNSEWTDGYYSKLFIILMASDIEKHRCNALQNHSTVLACQSSGKQHHLHFSEAIHYPFYDLAPQWSLPSRKCYRQATPMPHANHCFFVNPIFNFSAQTHLYHKDFTDFP